MLLNCHPGLSVVVSGVLSGVLLLHRLGTSGPHAVQLQDPLQDCGGVGGVAVEDVRQTVLKGLRLLEQIA